MTDIDVRGRHVSGQRDRPDASASREVAKKSYLGIGLPAEFGIGLDGVGASSRPEHLSQRLHDLRGRGRYRKPAPSRWSSYRPSMMSARSSIR